jgi:hypothetical protein
MVFAIAGFALQLVGQDAVRPEPRPVAHPYTAKFKITSEQTLANGTTITRETTETAIVDSHGRRLTETAFPATGQLPERSVIRVFDPVARTNTDWEVPGKKATVRPMPPHRQSGEAGSSCWTTGPVTPVASAPSSPELPNAHTTFSEAAVVSGSVPTSSDARPAAKEGSREDLGTQTIQGVQARGTRTTHTTPIGAVGNDAPLVRTTEVWMARSLNLMVRQVIDDPRTGKRTRELVELSQSEPDISAFQPPEGYEIETLELHEIPCSR